MDVNMTGRTGKFLADMSKDAEIAFWYEMLSSMVYAVPDNFLYWLTVQEFYSLLNPFPDDKNLTLSKLKAIADDKINIL